MTLLDVLSTCGSYNRYIQIHDMTRDKRSGIMKAGNITYKQIDHYSYKKRVHQLIPCYKQGKNVLFIQMGEE